MWLFTNLLLSSPGEVIERRVQENRTHRDKTFGDISENKWIVSASYRFFSYYALVELFLNGMIPYLFLLLQIYKIVHDTVTQQTKTCKQFG